MPCPWDTSNEVPCRETAGVSAPYEAPVGCICVSAPSHSNLNSEGTSKAALPEVTFPLGILEPVTHGITRRQVTHAESPS